MAGTARGAALTIVIAMASSTASAQEGPPLPPRRPPALDVPDGPAPPLPPPRPTMQPQPGPSAVFGPPMPPRAAAPAPSRADAGTVDEAETCRRLLASGKVVARLLPPVPQTPEGCGIAAPVELTAIVLSPVRRVSLEPPATINCTLADAVADWVRADLDPAFRPPGAPLAALAETSGYACRGRNGIAGAKLSEHARGNALDIGALRTADGTRIAVTGGAADRLAIVRATACARFATVLGPGSDGFHEHHMHVDLEPRRHGSQICHWELPNVVHDIIPARPPAPSWNAGRRGAL